MLPRDCQKSSRKSSSPTSRRWVLSLSHRQRVHQQRTDGFSLSLFLIIPHSFSLSVTLFHSYSLALCRVVSTNDQRWILSLSLSHSRTFSHSLALACFLTLSLSCSLALSLSRSLALSLSVMSCPQTTDDGFSLTLSLPLSRPLALSLCRSPGLSLSRSLVLLLPCSLALSLSRSLALSLSCSFALSLSRSCALSLSRSRFFSPQPRRHRWKLSTRASEQTGNGAKTARSSAHAGRHKV